MDIKLLKTIVFLVSVNFQSIDCYNNYNGYNNYEPAKHINSNIEQGIILRFPKYSIKVFAEKKEDNPYAGPPIHQNWDNDGYEPYPSDAVHRVQPNQPYTPIYQTPQHNNKQIEYYPIVHKFPLIHRSPIDKKMFCGTEKHYDPILGLPKSSQKHNQNMWYFGAPNWSTNTQNILRSEPPAYLQEKATDQTTDSSINIAETENEPIVGTSDPRFVHSSSKFIKIHKPFVSKLIISKQKTIGHDHEHSGRFGGHGGHFHQFDHPNHFGEHTIHNVNKNTNIHVHSRNSENQEQVEINDDNKREAKDPYYERIVGSHLFAAPRWRRDTLSRKKRGVIDAVKLVADHRTKIDIPKTAENVGAATRNLFEEDYSPVYHLRNALASAHDVIYTMLNVRPNGLLIPCRYKIVDGNEASPIVGSINPELYRQHGQRSSEGSIFLSPTDGENFSPDQTILSDGDPMRRMGQILRESVKWAHRSAEHAADAMHSARKAVITAKKHWPKLFVPYVRAVEIIPPGTGHEQDIVGSAKDPEFVGVGKMMDYLGMTDKKPDLSPRVGYPHFGGLQTHAQHIGLPHRKSEEEIILQKAKESLGSQTYHQFMSQLRKELDNVPPKKDTVGAPRLTPESLKAKLALDRLRSSIKLQKAKADLKLKTKLPVVKTHIVKPKPIIPKLPLLPKKPLLLRSPILRSEPPKLPSLTLNPILKSERVGAGNPLEAKEEPPYPEEISDPIEELKYKINEHIKIGSNERTNQEENNKNMNKHLDKLKDKLYEKYNIQTGDLNDDILGLAIEQAQKNDPSLFNENVGAALDETSKENVGAIPNPIYTKEMQAPFMGLATKEEMDKYFQQMYSNSNKKDR